LNGRIQNIQALGLLYRSAFELLDVGLHIDRGRGAQKLQKIGSLGKSALRIEECDLIFDCCGDSRCVLAVAKYTSCSLVRQTSKRPRPCGSQGAGKHDYRVEYFMRGPCEQRRGYTRRCCLHSSSATFGLIQAGVWFDQAFMQLLNRVQARLIGNGRSPHRCGI
jgi:hypothetical protein